MSKFEFKLPDIGEGVTEGEIVTWLVQEGDAVAENQDMVEVMTDKATVTIGAPKQGKVLELRSKVGDTVPVGEVLVVFETGADGSATAAPAPAATPTPAEAPAPGAPTAASAPAPSSSGPVASAVGDIRETLPGMETQQAKAATPKTEYFADKPLAAPATRKLARELGVDLRTIEPSGSAGRVTREDVERAASAGGAEEPAPAGPSVTDRLAAPVPEAAPRPTANAADERIPIRGLRKRIFENMARSKHTAAQFNYSEECNVGALIALRERAKPHAERAGVKLTFLPFLIKAVVAALKRHPRLNALVDEAAHEIVLRKNYDIGIAVATDAGLMVPVLREADRKSLVDIARELERLGGLARSGKIQKDDLGGSSFTVSSLGKLGGLLAPPIINHPEVGIMGVHAIKRKPVVQGDQIVIGDVMILSFSFDHRIIDGDVGAAFAQEIISYLEEPDRLLVEMS
ncbi:MAG TPA: dihydrolipoamide acetyltransferase family protein [Polyangiaceae bacterium]|nr:dihydrolipoamide acetyltransferase family protein [Polyangiaceae bacterium]